MCINAELVYTIFVFTELTTEITKNSTVHKSHKCEYIQNITSYCSDHEKRLEKYQY